MCWSWCVDTEKTLSGDSVPARQGLEFYGFISSFYPNPASNFLSLFYSQLHAYWLHQFLVNQFLFLPWHSSHFGNYNENFWKRCVLLSLASAEESEKFQFWVWLCQFSSWLPEFTPDSPRKSSRAVCTVLSCFLVNCRICWWCLRKTGWITYIMKLQCSPSGTTAKWTIFSINPSMVKELFFTA